MIFNWLKIIIYYIYFFIRKNINESIHADLTLCCKELIIPIMSNNP